MERVCLHLTRVEGAKVLDGRMRGGFIAINISIPSDVVLDRTTVVAELGLDNHLVGLNVLSITQYGFQDAYHNHVVGHLLHLVSTDGRRRGRGTGLAIDIVGNITVVLSMSDVVCHEQMEVFGGGEIGFVED